MISVRMTTPQRKRIDASRSFSIISVLRLALAEFGFEQERALGRDGDASGRKKPLGGPDEYDLAPFDGLHGFLRQRDKAVIATSTRLDPGAQALTGCQPTNALRCQDDRRGLAIGIEGG